MSGNEESTLEKLERIWKSLGQTVREDMERIDRVAGVDAGKKKPNRFLSRLSTLSLWMAALAAVALFIVTAVN